MTINQIIIFSGLLLSNLSQVAYTTEQQANGKNGQNYNEVNGDVNNKRVGTMKLTSLKNEIKIAPEHNISTNILNKINNLIIPKEIGFSEIFYSYKNKNFYIKNHKTNKTYNLKKTTNNFNYINTTNNKTIINNNQKTKTNYISNKTTIIDNRIDNSLTNYGVIIIDQSEKNNFNFSPKLNLKF